MSEEERSAAGLWGAPACPEHLLPLRRRVERFVNEQVLPHEAALDAGDRALHERIAGQAREAGLWGLALPAGLGGGGLTLTEYAHLAEAEGATDHGPALLGSTALLDLEVLDRHAVPAVRDRLAPRVAAGELTLCNAMTEPDVPGSDPGLVESRATRNADGSWTVQGRKWFISGADRADLAAVLVRTSGAAPDRDGLSVLLVPTGHDGFHLVRELPILGAGGQWEIALRDVTVPADHLLGRPGEGLRVLGDRVRIGRLLRCLRWLGQAQRAFLLMRDRARTRETASGVLAGQQHVHRLVFEALLAIRSTRPLVFEAVARVQAGLDARVETGLAKVGAARMLQEVTDAAIQVHGAAGLGPDTALPALLRAARAARLLDGPDELHVSAVAGRVLR